MTAFEAMFPTHATIAKVGTSPCAGSTSTPSPSAPSALSAVQESTPSILKYVVALDPIAQAERPIIFPWDIQHSTMIPLGHRAVSAGFIMIIGTNLIVLPEASTSLDLKPRLRDRAILCKFLSFPSPDSQKSQ